MVAAALIRLHRQRLPEPEDLFDDGRDSGQPPPRQPRRGTAYDPLREGPPLGLHGDGGEGATAWFRMPIGRQNNADPKWLIPLICRLGHVTKKDIGQIRIFPRETKFEIVAQTDPRFRLAVRGAAEGDIRIEPAAAAPPPAGARPPARRRSQARRRDAAAARAAAAAARPQGQRSSALARQDRERGRAVREVEADLRAAEVQGHAVELVEQVHAQHHGVVFRPQTSKTCMSA